MPRKSILPPPIYGKPISLGRASKKYDVPVMTLSHWAESGELAVLKKPEKRGQALLVDEASVVTAVLRRKRGYALGQPETVRFAEPAAVVPVVEPLHYSTADLVEAYHHFGETTGFKPLTMEKHRQILRVFTEKCPELPLTPGPILDFIHDLPWSMRRKKSYYEVIRQFYNYLVDFHQIPTPLTPRMVPRAPRHPYFRVLSREEVTKVINKAENFQERMILETLYATAVRAEELATLTSDNLHPDYIVVTGKTGTLEKPISQELHARLGMLGDGPLFRGRHGKPMTRDGIGQRVRKCMLAAGITGKKLGPHTFRHTALTHLYEDTGDIRLAQELAGHTDIQTTQIYTHPRAAVLKKKLGEHDLLKKLGEGKRSGAEAV